MQIFIDSADPDEIRTAWGWGIMDGVTTNPSLAAKTGKPYSEIVKEILEILDEEASISLEVVAEDYEGMLKQARSLAALDERVVVKLPCTTDGIKACKKLSAEGILVNITLVFSVAQALLAAKAGAFYVSPFVGRLNDVEDESGNQLVDEIIGVFGNYDIETSVLFASTRDRKQLEKAAISGADIVTAPFAVLQEMFNHELTSKGLEKFRKDWEESGLKLPI